MNELELAVGLWKGSLGLSIRYLKVRDIFFYETDYTALLIKKQFIIIKKKYYIFL